MTAASATGLPLIDTPPASPPSTSLAASGLPRVPSEPAPRPAPVLPESRAIDTGLEVSAKPGKLAAKSAPRSVRGPVRIRPLADKEERTRLSVRLASSVDEKLDDLAHLRGLDRNTAVSVAIVQDWVACFGRQARQPGH